MSAPRSQPLGVRSPTPAEAAVLHKQADLQACQRLPFYLVRFRTTMLRMIQQYFESTAGWPTGEGLPTLCGLAYDKDSGKSTVDVRLVYDEHPSKQNHATVFVRTLPMTLSKIADSDYADISANLSTVLRVKGYTTGLSITADHYDADVSMLLLEGLVNYLEGTKFSWMDTFDVQSFDVLQLSGPVMMGAKSDAMMRSTLTCEVKGRLCLAHTTEALPLKRVVLSVQP